MGLNTKL